MDQLTFSQHGSRLAPPFQWSEEQEAIFAWFTRKNPEHARNLLVRARAGTGKTTTIMEGVSRAPEREILVCAYNREAREDLARKIKHRRAIVKTCHSMGYKAVTRQVSVLFDPKRNAERRDRLTDAVCKAVEHRWYEENLARKGPLRASHQFQTPDKIKRLISNLHTQARELLPCATLMGELTDLMLSEELLPLPEYCNCRLCEKPCLRTNHPADASHPFIGYDAVYVEQQALAAMALAAKVKAGDLIDYTDMLFLPLRNEWLVPLFDLVVIDEAQDWTVPMLEIAQLLCRGRLCIVGDDRQAIYEFRGANSGSLDNLKSSLDAIELGLMTSYRCASAIVREAQQFVPDIRPAPDAACGAIQTLHYNQLSIAAQPGDFILSRINAPLMDVALALIKQHKRVRILGRDIGDGVQQIIRSLQSKTCEELGRKIRVWEESERLRIRTNIKVDAQEPHLTRLDNRVAMVKILASSCPTIEKLLHVVHELFDHDDYDKGAWVTCSSVHKIKGKEAERVFVLRETLLATPLEECNIQYVAITRAQQTLVWVHGLPLMPGDFSLDSPE